jgi:hypothetical protein
MLTSTSAYLIFALIGPAAALLAMGPNTCDGENTSLSDITFCNSYALGLAGGGVLTIANETLLTNRTILTFMRVNSSLDLWIEYWNSSYWLNGYLKLNDVVNVMPGPAAFDYTQETFHAIVVSTLDPGYFSFLRVNFKTMIVSFYSILTSPAYGLIWNGQYVLSFIQRLGTYRYTAFGTGTNLTIVGPIANSMVLLDSETRTFTYLPNVTGLCAINCSQWIVRDVQTSSSQTVSTIVPTLNETSTSFVSQTSGESTSSVSPTSEASTLILAQTTTSQFIWIDTIYIPDPSLPLFNFPGTFVVPPDSVLQVDFRNLEVIEGQTIPLFTFASLEGSFKSIEMITTSCTSMHGELQTTPTTMNIIVTSSTSVCAASSKLAIDPLRVNLYV